MVEMAGRKRQPLPVEEALNPHVTVQIQTFRCCLGACNIEFGGVLGISIMQQATVSLRCFTGLFALKVGLRAKSTVIQPPGRDTLIHTEASQTSAVTFIVH